MNKFEIVLRHPHFHKGHRSIAETDSLEQAEIIAQAVRGVPSIAPSDVYVLHPNQACKDC